MSFILQDKQLVNLLIKAAQAAPAQYAGVGPQDFAALQGIIDNLEKQLSAGPAAGPEITTGSGNSAALTSLNMKNLSSLVNFLGMNGIKVNGKNVVVGANDLPNDPSYVPYQFEGDSTFRPSTNLTFKVNKPLLEQYLNTLRGQLVQNPNPVMSAQVEAMVQEANQQLGTNVSKTYQEPAKTLDPGRQLDELPQDIRTNSPLSQGNVPLTFGDISSDTGFNNWIQKNNVSIDGRAYRHPQYDKCGLVKILNARAKYYVSNATSQQQKEVYAVYAEQVPRLATMLQCDLGETAKGTTEQQGGQAPAGQAGAAGQQVATLQQLGEILPLERDVLDFGKIRDFINSYRTLITAGTEANRAQQANTAMDQLEQYMQAATRNTAGQSMTTFSMDGLTANDLVQWATPPSQGEATRSRGSARALADYLEQVVRNVYIILKDLYNSHYRQLTDPRNNLEDLNNSLQQQVGGPSIPFGSSIASGNLDDIQTARARLPQVGA